MGEPANMTDPFYRVLEFSPRPEHFTESISPETWWVLASVWNIVGFYFMTGTWQASLAIAVIFALGYRLGWYRSKLLNWTPYANHYSRIELGPGRRLVLESIRHRLQLDAKDIHRVLNPFWAGKFCFHARLLDGSKAILVLNPRDKEDMWAWLRRHHPTVELP